MRYFQCLASEVWVDNARHTLGVRPASGLETDDGREARAVVPLRASHVLQAGHGQWDCMHVGLRVIRRQQAGVGGRQAQAIQHLFLGSADIHLGASGMLRSLPGQLLSLRPYPSRELRSHNSDSGMHSSRR